LATKLTVAIPTHNRAASLRETLASVAALKIPSGAEVDCLVIDNGSSDSTAAVAEEFARSASMPARRVFEPRLGSSFARNRAADESAGANYIFFIDDDATAEPEWALEMLSAMDRRNLDCACGSVVPRWTAPPPQWLGTSLWVKLAVHDPRAVAAADQSALERMSNYFSANVGFRRSAFERFGRFREDLGVVGSNPISGEDTELFARIIAGGGRMGFVPRAIVHHSIPPERMTRAYLRRKSFAYGVGTAITGGTSHNRLDKLIKNAGRMTVAAIRGDREKAIYHELECANFFGYWRGRLLPR